MCSLCIAERHVGDLGNLVVTTASPSNLGVYNDTNDLLTLTGPNSIVGRSVIIHQENDKGVQPLGDAKTKIAGCVIGYVSTEPTLSDICPVTPVPTTSEKKASTATTNHSVFSLFLVLVAMLMFLMN